GCDRPGADNPSKQEWCADSPCKCSTRVENRNRQCADFQRENFAHSQVSRARCGRCNEEDYCPGKSLRLRSENTGVKKPAGQREQNSRESIRGRDHFFASDGVERSEEHTSELQSPCNLVCRLLLEK